MIIVNQEKSITLNYESTLLIYIDDMGTNRKIIALLNNRQVLLGEYATSERTYEVKRQIEVAYVNCELVKIPNMNYQEPVASERIAKNICFEMPKE